MATVTIYQNLDGVDCVQILNDDGTSWSGYKADHDAQQAKVVTPFIAPIVNPTP